MARPQLEIGTYGDIASKEERPGSWRATARFRDLDGETRLVKAYGPTEGKAKSALRTKLKTRRRGTAGTDTEITPETRLGDLLEHWLKVLQAEHAAALRAGGHPQRSEGTMYHYRRCSEKVIVPAIGKLRVRELTTPRVDKFLRELPGNVKMARTVLQQVSEYAIRYGAMDFNPVAAAFKPPKPQRKPRALTPDEAILFRERITAWQGAKHHGPRRGADRLELFDVLLSTGMRIGELLALEWSDVSGLDDTDSSVTVRIGWHVDFRGRRVELRKGNADPITLTVAALGVDALLRQRERGLPWDLVFPSAVGTPQLESNVYRNWRAARGEDLEWVKTHTVRKTVVTAVERHLGLESAARQAGHASSEVTRMHYVERNQIVPDHTEALNEFSLRIRSVGA